MAIADIPLCDLDPGWVGHGGDDIIGADGHVLPFRPRVALSFLCPCNRAHRHTLYIANPEDGLSAIGYPAWHRTGCDFDQLVLTPSILSNPAKGGCGWHGFIGGASGNKPGIVETV